MRGRALARHPLHEHVQHGVGEGVVLFLDQRLDLLLHQRLGHRHLGRGEPHRPRGHQPAAGRPLLPRRPVGPGHVGGLEPLHHIGAELQVADTRHRRQVVGVRDADRGPRLGRREGAQTDPVGEIGVQAAQLALLQALRGQQQMHPEGPADPADLDEHVDEVGLGGEEFGELVDDQHQ